MSPLQTFAGMVYGFARLTVHDGHFGFFLIFDSIYERTIDESGHILFFGSRNGRLFHIKKNVEKGRNYFQKRLDKRMKR